MKPLVILSGKGGTGKTTVSAALMWLTGGCVSADCDVDAPNLRIILGGEDLTRQPYIGGTKARIDQDKCIGCGACLACCRFGAIHFLDGTFRVEGSSCEGCGVCSFVCPSEAVIEELCQVGEVMTGISPLGPFAHAQLIPGEDGSGKLVLEVRREADAKWDQQVPLLIDGPPGLACPVISALSGCQVCLIVCEPTEASFHDMYRLIDVAEKMQVKPVICINRFDLNPEKSEEIVNWCKVSGFVYAGAIPYDPMVSEALAAGQPINRFAPASPAAQGIEEIYRTLLRYLA
jgi:MinD superfamily P-loop ATPase